MATQNNPVIGYIVCNTCEQRGSVHVTKRGKGRYLYKRCECGADQRTGAAYQSWLYNHTEWLDAPPEKPPNYKEPTVEIDVKNIDTSDGSDENEPSPPEKTKPTEKKPLLVAGITGIAVIALALMGKTR